MSIIKKQEEIKYILEGGKLLGEILEKLADLVEPGISTWKIDVEAEKMIKAVGGRPAFKNYRSSRDDIPFPGTICASINEEVVHGIPKKDRFLKEGDILSIDIGMQYPVNSGLGKGGNGFFTDTALTVAVGKINEETKKLLDATKNSLEKVISEIKIGDSVSDIGKTIENYIQPFGYGIVRDLVGHGVGHEVHEEPSVPNYFEPALNAWKITPGVVLAVEPMITLGNYRVDVSKDGWSFSTVDKSLSAHFEHTLVFTEKGLIVATRRPKELK